MVVFTCINCGESVKKTVVSKHYMGRCRGPPNVTCVDCLKDFRGSEYEAHTKCVTEEERYSAKGFVPKPASNKGEKKQQSWCEAIQSILTSEKVQGDERQLLELLSAHENVPRKKGKFLNFIASAHRAFAKRQNLVERVWSIIEEAGKPATVLQQKKDGEEASGNGINTDAIATNGDTEEIEPSKKKRKKNSEDIPEETEKSEKKKKRDKNTDVGTVNGSNGMMVNGSGNFLSTDHAAGVKTETSISLLRKLVNTAGGSSTLYKLQQSLSEYCANEFGSEKAGKRLKKIQKDIKVTLSGDNVYLT